MRRRKFTVEQVEKHLIQKWRNPELVFEYWRQRHIDTKEKEVCPRPLLSGGGGWG